MFNLATIHEDQGEWGAARNRYVRALLAAPGHAPTVARLAMLDLHAGQTDAAVAALQQALADPRHAAEDAAELQFALARSFDAQDDPDRAFAMLSRANETIRHVARARGFAYDPGRHEALVDQLIATFPLPAAASSRSGTAPLFVCGLFRSGSTLTEQILAAHSRVTAGGELELVPSMIGDRLQPYPVALRTTTPDGLDALRRTYLATTSGLYPDAGILTDKLPDNFLHIGLIKSIFPEAKIVHTRRNIADNVLSIYFMNFQNAVSYGFDLQETMHWVAQHDRIMAHWQRSYGNDIFEIDYDALVADPRPVIAGLLSFCGLDWEDACLAPDKVNNIVRTGSVRQVREPLHRRASGRATGYSRYLADALRRPEQT